MLGAYIRTIDLILPADILKPLCNAIAMCCYPSSYRVKRPFDVEMNRLVTFDTHSCFPPSVEFPRLLQPKDFHITFDLAELFVTGNQLDAAVLCQGGSEAIGIRHFFTRLKDGGLFCQFQIRWDDMNR